MTPDNLVTDVQVSDQPIVRLLSRDIVIVLLQQGVCRSVSFVAAVELLLEVSEDQQGHLVLNSF